MKIKGLRKKIRRLEKRLREGPQKLAELKRRLEAAEATKVLSAARKSASRAAAALIAEGRKRPAKKPKRKLNLSPERRAQLSAAMKARWAVKRAAEANAKIASTAEDFTVEPSPQAPEAGHAA
jgi:hypothetical protein